jgi:hypothetical protein
VWTAPSLIRDAKCENRRDSRDFPNFQRGNAFLSGIASTRRRSGAADFSNLQSREAVGATFTKPSASPKSRNPGGFPRRLSNFQRGSAVSGGRPRPVPRRRSGPDFSKFQSGGACGTSPSTDLAEPEIPKIRRNSRETFETFRGEVSFGASHTPVPRRSELTSRTYRRGSSVSHPVTHLARARNSEILGGNPKLPNFQRRSAVRGQAT